jgi:hypothetical protein
VAAANLFWSIDSRVVCLSGRKTRSDLIMTFFSVVSNLDVTMDGAIGKLAKSQLEIMTEQIGPGFKSHHDAKPPRVQLASSEQAAVTYGRGAREWTLKSASSVRHVDAHGMRLESSKPATPSSPPLSQLSIQVMLTHPTARVQHTKIDVARPKYPVDRRTLPPTADVNACLVATQGLDHFNGRTFHRRPRLFASHLQVEILLFDFGLRRAAIREWQESEQSENARVKGLALELRQATTRIYNQIEGIYRTPAALHDDYAKVNNNAEFRKNRHRKLVDELTRVGAASTSLGGRESLDSQESPERLNTELQNFSVGLRRWVQ